MPVSQPKTAVLSARYTEEENLDAFFQSIFGYGNASVTVRNCVSSTIMVLTATKRTRGRFQCVLPRSLTPVRLLRQNSASTTMK
jgi:hypothetical protein